MLATACICVSNINLIFIFFFYKELMENGGKRHSIHTKKHLRDGLLSATFLRKYRKNHCAETTQWNVFYYNEEILYNMKYIPTYYLYCTASPKWRWEHSEKGENTVCSPSETSLSVLERFEARNLSSATLYVYSLTRKFSSLPDFCSESYVKQPLVFWYGVARTVTSHSHN